LSAPLLVIDAGNTELTLGAFARPADGSAGLGPLQTWRIPTYLASGTDTPEDSRLLLERLSLPLAAHGFAIAAFEDVVLASVVPAVTQSLQAAIPGLRIVDSSWPFSFRIATAEPARTGIDRLVNAEAALRTWGDQRPLVVLDAGTASTIDAISAPQSPHEKPVFLGVAFLAGLAMLRDALHPRTAQLPRIELAAPGPVPAIGSDTASALKSGVWLGYCSMIEGMLARVATELKATYGGSPDVRVVATGGLASLLAPHCPSIQDTDPHLTLKGIAWLYESLRAR
jgi:type III pantothenate kinase